jgi:hypothetical protein
MTFVLADTMDDVLRAAMPDGFQLPTRSKAPTAAEDGAREAAEPVAAAR